MPCIIIENLFPKETKFIFATRTQFPLKLQILTLYIRVPIRKKVVLSCWGINSSTYCFLFRSVFLHTQSFHFPNFLHPYTSSEKNIKSYLSTYIIVAIYLQCLRDSIFSRASFQQKLFQLGFRKESFKIPP